MIRPCFFVRGFDKQHGDRNYFRDRGSFTKITKNLALENLEPYGILTACETLAVIQRVIIEIMKAINLWVFFNPYVYVVA